MSADIIPSDVRDDEPAQAFSGSSRTAERIAFYLPAARGRPLFAWVHEPPVDKPRLGGVLLCPSIGYEQLHAHRSYRHLAEALASAGFVALRIDYDGTGDSPGDDLDPQRLDVWTENVRRAATWLRAEAGCHHVAIVGLRVGALLATLAAEQEVADELVLWAPIIKGSSLVREWRAISLTAAATASLERREGDPIQASGFQLSEETAERISKVNLIQLTPRVRRALVVSRDDGPASTPLVDHLRGLGIDTAEYVGSGYSDMLTLPHETRVPRDTIRSIVDWFLTRDQLESRESASRMPPSTVARDDSMVFSSGEVPIRERPLVVSDHPRLFGIVAEPVASPPDDRPFLVLLNAGAAYRIGPGRLTLELARRMAADGFRSLRLDLGGLGDSVADDPKRENDPYAATAMRDIGLTLRYLRNHERARRFVLIGLCSGAYDAFQFAAQNVDPTLVEILLINPLTFFWRDGMTIDDPANLKVNTWLTYLDAARQPAKWKRLLSGRSRLGVLGTIRKFARGVGLLSTRPDPSPESTEHRDLVGSEFGGHPDRDDLKGDLARIERSGTQLSMFFAQSDPGHFILKVRAGRKARQLQQAGKLTLHFQENADHTFSVAQARAALIESLGAHLRARYPASVE